jgi:outer membrane protein assembly factor BamE (lipoprotein component of BamABCDE complex)
MTHNSSRWLAVSFLFTTVALFAWGGTSPASRPPNSAGAAQSAQTGTSPQKDRTQWRNLRRRMSKDDVKKLLGEPTRVSVSRFYEAWDYPGGTVIFDGKGRLDAWSEL